MVWAHVESWRPFVCERRVCLLHVILKMLKAMVLKKKVPALPPPGQRCGRSRVVESLFGCLHACADKSSAGTIRSGELLLLCHAGRPDAGYILGSGHCTRTSRGQRE